MFSSWVCLLFWFYTFFFFSHNKGYYVTLACGSQFLNSCFPSNRGEMLSVFQFSERHSLLFSLSFLPITAYIPVFIFISIHDRCKSNSGMNILVHMLIPICLNKISSPDICLLIHPTTHPSTQVENPITIFEKKIKKPNKMGHSCNCNKL